MWIQVAVVSRDACLALELWRWLIGGCRRALTTLSFQSDLNQKKSLKERHHKLLKGFLQSGSKLISMSKEVEAAINDMFQALHIQADKSYHD
jgi:hypothetical protein